MEKPHFKVACFTVARFKVARFKVARFKVACFKTVSVYEKRSSVSYAKK